MSTDHNPPEGQVAAMDTSAPRRTLPARRPKVHPNDLKTLRSRARTAARRERARRAAQGATRSWWLDSRPQEVISARKQTGRRYGPPPKRLPAMTADGRHVEQVTEPMGNGRRWAGWQKADQRIHGAALARGTARRHRRAKKAANRALVGVEA